jgi:hypothetical protein
VIEATTVLANVKRRRRSFATGQPIKVGTRLISALEAVAT